LAHQEGNEQDREENPPEHGVQSISGSVEMDARGRVARDQTRNHTQSRVTSTIM
jgi:hypothetical protein